MLIISSHYILLWWIFLKLKCKLIRNLKRSFCCWNISFKYFDRCWDCPLSKLCLMKIQKYPDVAQMMGHLRFSIFYGKRFGATEIRHWKNHQFDTFQTELLSVVHSYIKILRSLFCFAFWTVSHSSAMLFYRACVFFWWFKSVLCSESSWLKSSLSVSIFQNMSFSSSHRTVYNVSLAYLKLCLYSAHQQPIATTVNVVVDRIHRSAIRNWCNLNAFAFKIFEMDLDGVSFGSITV